MSIANEVQRLQTAKTAIKSAIESKGVTVGDGTIDTYADKINEISSGGGTGPSGYWERYIEVGPQIGPSDFDWPTTPNIITEITSIHGDYIYGTMPDGRMVYRVQYGSVQLETYCYKEVYQG